MQVTEHIVQAIYRFAHPNISPADIATPPLDHVSGLEYWTLNSLNPDAAAKITLYYTPYSRVGQGGNDAQALLDLRIAQYWDSISGGGVRKWRLYGLGGPYVITGNVNYGKITYNQFATDLSFGSQNFTLGTVSLYNTLPIQLISWIAVPQGNRVQLRWQVADESDVLFTQLKKVRMACTIALYKQSIRPSTLIMYIPAMMINRLMDGIITG